MNQGEAGTEPEPATVSWSVLPFRDKGVKAVLLVAVFATVTVVIQKVFRSPLFDVLALLLLFYSTRSFWLPVRYSLSFQALSVDTAERKLVYNWRSFRSFQMPGGALVLLAADASPDRAEAEAGSEGKARRLVIPVPPVLEQDVVRYIRGKTQLVERP